MKNAEQVARRWLQHCEEPPEGIELWKIPNWLRWKCKEVPEEAWGIVLEIYKQHLTVQQMDCVSRGLYPLFREYSDLFMSRANELAAGNPQFARTLIAIDEYVEKQSEEWIAQQWLTYFDEHYADKGKNKPWLAVFGYRCWSEPEKAWRTICAIIQHDMTEKRMLMLGVGKLENLLAGHAPDFIERVEQLAATNAKFAKILGAVWQRDMTEDIWQRIEKARSWLWP